MESVLKGGEEAEAAAAAATPSSAEDPSAMSSPTEESKPETEVTLAIEEKKEEAKPVETAAPVSAATASAEEPVAKKEEAIKPVEAATPVVAEKKVEVSAESGAVAADVRKTTEETTSESQVVPPSPIKAQTDSTTTSSDITTSFAKTLISSEAVSAVVVEAQPAPVSPPSTPIDTLAMHQTPTASELAEALEEPAAVAAAASLDSSAPALTAKSEAVVNDTIAVVESVKLETNVKPKACTETDVVLPPPPPSAHVIEPLVEDDDDDSTPPPLPESPAPAELPSSKAASFAASTMLHNEGDDEELPPPPPMVEEADLIVPAPVVEEAAKTPVIEAVVETSVHVVPAENVPLQNGFHSEELQKTTVPVEDEDEEEAPSTPITSDEAKTAAQQQALEAVPEPPKTNGMPDDALVSPPSAIPTEIVQLAPAITEDVASVIKAIEEIDINEKAVAAAVESAGVNEIVADSVHQNNKNE